MRTSAAIQAALILSVAICALISGCGGGGGGGSSVAPAPVAQAQGSSAGAGTVEGRITQRVSGRAATATAIVDMPVSGATVTCAFAVGLTDATGYFSIANVPAGRQTCEAVKEGRTVARFPVDVAPGAVTRAQPEAGKPDETGGVEIGSAPDGAAVILDSVLLSATTPVALDQVPIGTHTVTVRMEGYEPAATQTVVVEKGRTQTLAFTLVSMTAASTGEPNASPTQGPEVTTTPTPDATTGAEPAEPTCEGDIGLCMDIEGAGAAAGGTVEVAIRVWNPTNAGLGAGVLDVTWDAGRLSLLSPVAEAGVTVLAEKHETPGRFAAAFISEKPLLGSEVLMRLRFAVSPNAAGNAVVRWKADGTGLSDFSFDMLAPSLTQYRDGYVVIRAMM